MLRLGKWKESSVVAVLLLAVVASACSKDTVKVTAPPPQPESLKQVERLNAAADEMYNKLVQGDVGSARTKLNEIGEQVTQIRFNGIATVEGVQALADSIVEAKRELNAAAFSKPEGQQAAARVRLATDALTHRNEPMWLQYYKGMKENVNDMEHAAEAGKTNDALHAFTTFTIQYNVIRPSAMITRTPSEVERMESIISFLTTQLNAAKWDSGNIKAGIGHLDGEVDKLFHRKEAEAFMPFVEDSNPVWSIAFLGSIIVMVLAFAAWRIFQVERGIVGDRRAKNRNDKFLK